MSNSLEAERGQLTQPKYFGQTPLALLTTTQDALAAGGTNRQVTLLLSNTTSGAVTATIYLKPTAATANADALALCKGFSIAANTQNLSLTGIVVPKGYVISALASATGMNLTIFGNEER